MPDGYDAILVEAKLAANKKFRRLPPAERWCVVFGVWAIAAQSPVRGYLFLTETEPAREDDYAAEANVTIAVARSTVKKMRSLGMIEHDPEMGAEYVHDWHKHQPEPKPSDSKAAWKERKRAERERKRTQAESRVGHDNVTRDVTLKVTDNHAPLSKRKEKNPPNPPRGNRKKDQEAYEQELEEWATSEFPDVPTKAAIGYTKAAQAEGLAGRDEICAYVLRWTGAAA